jgi:hypothetical protein
MDKEEIKQYIGYLLNEPKPDQKIIDEILEISIILIAYMTGLQNKKFPVDILLREIDIEKEIPVQFHTLVAQGAILKSKKGNEYILKNSDKLLEELRKYL